MKLLHNTIDRAQLKRMERSSCYMWTTMLMLARSVCPMLATAEKVATEEKKKRRMSRFFSHDALCTFLVPALI
jgi:hypothetical protein